MNSYNDFDLHVLSFMYDFLASFGMHGTFMWLFCYDFSLAWKINLIDSGFSQHFHFLDSHGIVDFPIHFMIGGNVHYGCGLSYQFGSLGWKNAL